MLTPAYKLTIGSRVVDTTDEPKASTIVELTVALDMDTPADSFTLVLGQVGGLAPARDDEAKIELGYADEGLAQVMKGKVDAIEPGLTTRRVIGYSAAAELLHTFVDFTYESKTAGAIVRDLAKKADVEVAAAEEGIEFPAYVIDGRRSLLRHMHDLADLCGFDLYINAEGRLVFEKFTRGKTVHILEYAKHVIELQVLQTPPAAASVEAWGEGPGGGRAPEAWAWLTRDFSGSKGITGSGNPKMLLERSALRSAQAAAMAAEAAYSRVRRRAIRGRLLLLGQPEIKLGDSLRLSSVPDENLNGTFQVRSVTHRITKTGGFTTTVGFRFMES